MADVVVDLDPARHHRVVANPDTAGHTDHVLKVEADPIADDQLCSLRYLESHDPGAPATNRSVIPKLDPAVPEDLRHGTFQMQALTYTGAAVA